MSLICRIGNKDFTLSDLWIEDEDAFLECGETPEERSQYFKNLVQEDISLLIEEIDLVENCEFFWTNK